MSIDIKKLKALAEAATGFSDVSLAPDVLLELIDQNERLTKNYKSLCDSVAHLNAATTSAGDEVARLRAENESANSRLHEVAVACATAEQERDQLRAEIAGLRTGYEAYERVNAELKGENEALRKALTSSREFLVRDAKVRRMTDGARHISPMFPLRKLVMEQIDAALGKEEQS